MSDDITPALTPHRWAVYQRLCEDIGGEPSAEMLGDHVESEHELAALALVGQPFGPTPAMVEAITAALDFVEAEALEHNYNVALTDRAERTGVGLRAALAFIRALLPPETT